MAFTLASGPTNTIDYGSDASIDDYTVKGILMHMNPGTPTVGSAYSLIGKQGAAAVWGFSNDRAAAGESNSHLRWRHDFSGLTDGDWATPNNSVSNGVDQHVAVSYDRSSTANNPDIYIEGSLQSEAELLPPAGSANSDAALDLRQGAAGGDHTVGWLTIVDHALTPGEVNQHRWWGRLPGAEVQHPMWTDSLVNKGTATADGTKAGTVTFTAMPRVMRPGCGGM